MGSLQVEEAALATVPRAFAVQHALLPFARSGNRLRVATSLESEPEALDALGCITGLEVVSASASTDEIAAAIERCYGKAPAPAEAQVESTVTWSTEPAKENDSHATIDADASDAPVIAWVHGLIHEALRRRASDLHVEPLEQRLRVRYRVDGVLLEGEGPPKALQPAIISRIKIMADISIAEKRVPQDGRIQVNVAEGSLDLRVSVVPSVHGESIVMRLLAKESLRPSLSELGFFADEQKRFERLIGAPDGIVLVTGPTGSGKTTTLYSCLHQLNRPGRKIITVEDPVEYQLSGVNQVPVRAEIGMTFAAALRAMLRQSPNVVMVGEIRDAETAEIALQAALTGHLVFSTLHTNDAIGAVTRLIDLGAKPYLVASAVRGVLAQRLVRRVCPSCQRAHQPEPAELRAIDLPAAELANAQFRKGVGCAACNGTGYAGRMVISELLELNDELRAMIHAGASTRQLRNRARELGLRTLRNDGLRKVTAGLTTIEEVVSMTVSDPR